MVQGTKVIRLIAADQRADRWNGYSHTVLLLALAATMTYSSQAQNIEGQAIAAQYGEFKVQNESNGFAFDPANCTVSGGGHNFPAFTTGTPVKVVDAMPAQTEITTAVTAFLSGSYCAVSLGGLAYQHTSFYLTSGSGGLQEALNNEKIRAGGNNTIILNARWYELIAPRTASLVISTVSGSYSFGLVDVTTNPYTSYNWNGSQYVQAAASGGSPSGAAGGALSGTYPNPGLSSNPIALPAGSTATTCTAGENDTKVATNACVAAAASSGGPPSGAAGGALAGTYPNPSFASPLNLSTGGTFSSNTSSPSGTNTYLNALINGCNPATEVNAVQYNYSMTGGLVGCVTGPAAGSGVYQINGVTGLATTNDANAVGGYFQARALANNAHVFGINPVVQDVAGNTSGVGMVGEEIDWQPYNAPSAYSAGCGLCIDLINNTNNGGTYNAASIQFGARVNGGSTPAYWQNGLSFLVGALGPGSVALNLNAIGTATSGANYNCPTLLNAYEGYWTGSANVFEGWTMNCTVGTGTNPAADFFKIGHGAGTAPSGQTHTFELTSGIQLQLDGSTSGSAVLSAAATGGTLNLGSTNASVTPAGALTVASCTGCGGSGGSPTGAAGGSLSGNYPNPGLSPTVAIPAGASIPSVGTIRQVDGFGAYSACVARGAWSSLTAYNPCDTVTNGGLTWIAVNANTNVTPVQSSVGGTQNWLPFRSDGANVAATQADYAFFSAYALVNLNSTSFSSNASVSLVFGAPIGGYLKNGDWVMPNNTYGYTVSLFGQGRGQTVITQNYTTLNYMVAQPPASSSGGQIITGIEFNANLLAAGCLDAHIRRSTYRDLVCFNPQYQSGQTQIGSQSWNSAATGATFLFGFAGDAYELDVSQILTRTPAYAGLVAAIGTATVTSGAITAITYTGTGTSLNLPVTAGPGLVAYFMGKGASGTSYLPCGTMPVVSAIALTGGSINTGSGIGGLTFSNAGATCGGTIYVVIQEAATIPYGYYFGSTDSSFKDIVSSGDFTQACQYDNHGSNVYDHEHPYCKAPYQIVANGGGPGQASDTHKAIEFDSPTQYGMYILRAGETINSYTAQWNSTTGYPGAGEILMDSTANTVSIGPSWCGGFQQAGGYAKFTGTATGIIASTNTTALANMDAYIYGNQANCDGSETGAGYETIWGQYLAGWGANFPATAGVVYNTNTSASRNAAASDFLSLVGYYTGAYSSGVTYKFNDIAVDGSGNNYVSLSAGNVGNALTNATYWHFLGGVSSTITGGNCVTSGNYMSGISTTGVPNCGQVLFSNLGGSATLAQLPSIANNSVLGNTSGSAAVPSALTALPAAVMPALTGDCTTIAGAVATTCTKTNGTSFGTAATQNTGTSGATVPLLNGANTYSGASIFSAASTFSAAGAASTPGLTVSGAPFTGGSATTTFPQFYLNAGAAVTTFSTSGTMFGVNAPSGFSGHLLNLFVNGSSTKFRVDSAGDLFVAGTTTLSSNVGLSSTAAPTMAAGAAAGTSPTCTSVTGNNNSGVISCTTGTSTTASATLATITFNGTLGTVPNGCTLFPRNATTALLATDVYTTAPTSTTFTIAVGATAATASTGYVWSYLCF